MRTTKHLDAGRALASRDLSRVVRRTVVYHYDGERLTRIIQRKRIADFGCDHRTLVMSRYDDRNPRSGRWRRRSRRREQRKDADHERIACSRVDHYAEAA